MRSVSADVDKDDGKAANFELWLTALCSLGLQKEKPNASHFPVSLFQATVPTTVNLCHVYTCWSFSLCWLGTRFVWVSCLRNVLPRQWRGALHFCEGRAFSFYGTHSRRSSPDLSCCVAWSQPGQVAPVTLHRPGRTKHRVSVEQLPLQGT